MPTTRVTSVNAISFLVPDAAVGEDAGGSTIDFDALPPSPAAQAEIDAAQADATQALADAAAAQADATQALADAATAQATADSALLSPEVLVVRTAADLPAAVAGVRTIPNTARGIWLLASVALGTDRIVVPDTFEIIGLGGTATGLTTANASPLVTGKRLILRDVGLANSAGPAVRIAGTIANDPAASLRGSGALMVGASASGVVQVHNADFVTFRDSAWTQSSGVGLRLTGGVRAGFIDGCFIRNNAAAFTGFQIPGGGAATITDRVLIHGCGFDLASGGVGVDADAAALSDEALHLEVNVFPDPATPGVGTPITGVDANDPECHFAGNLNLENTHVRGVVTMAVDNSTPTTITNTTDYFKLAGTTVLADASLFDSPAAGTLRCLAPGRTRVRLTAYLSLVTSSPNQDLLTLFAITTGNGLGATTLLTAFDQEGVTGGASGLRINALSFQAVVTLDRYDWIDVRVRNLTGANNVTWRHGQVWAEEVNG